MSAFVQRSHAEDHAPTLAISQSHVPENTPSLVDGKNAWIMARSDYPRIKYWTRAEWASRREVDDIETPPGPRGGSRCAKGENVMMRYIESPDGTPVSGAVASDIREYARSIWRGFYDRGFAPPTWGGASRKLEDQFNHEMEKAWPVLRYCESHWKTRHMATSIYSQWYSAYQSQKENQKRKQQDQRDSQATKKSRTATEDTYIECPEREQVDVEEDTSGSIPPVEDIGRPEHEQVAQEDVGARTSMPRARPLRNPL